ncbi:MAG: hypothetical protein L7U72_08125 [Rubripirellula sp.]|nr:hypothetical protein [Rubripirellula sp.]
MQQSTFAWLFSNASLVPAALGVGAAVIGLIFFVRPSRRGSLVAAFLSLAPAIVGMLMVYSAAKDFKELATDDSVVKPGAIVQCVGRGIGTGLFSLFGASIAMYVALLALLRSWKRNRTTDSPVRTEMGAGFTAVMGSQAYQARSTKGLNAYEPDATRSQSDSQTVGLDLDDVIAGSGVGFMPGSPTAAMAGRRASHDDVTTETRQNPDDDDPSIIDVEEV